MKSERTRLLSRNLDGRSLVHILILDDDTVQGGGVKDIESRFLRERRSVVTYEDELQVTDPKHLLEFDNRAVRLTEPSVEIPSRMSVEQLQHVPCNDKS